MYVKVSISTWVNSVVKFICGVAKEQRTLTPTGSWVQCYKIKSWYRWGKYSYQHRWLKGAMTSSHNAIAAILSHSCSYFSSVHPS